MALTDEQLDILSESLQPLFQHLEKEVIADVARRMQKTLTYTRTAELQVMSMRELGFSPAKIQREALKLLNADEEFRKQIEENTLQYKKEVRELIKEITEKAKEAGDEIVANAGTMCWIDDMSVWQSGGKELGDNSFLHQLVESISKQTRGEMKNITRTTGFKTMSGYESLESVYKREMDKAIIKICTGAFDREKVLKDAIHELSQSGLRSIDFASGRSMQLDTAVRVALRTGCHQLSGQVTNKNIEQMGENLVYVSTHWGARNTGTGHANHAQWQGKVYCIKKGPDYSKEAKRINQDSIAELYEATGYSIDGSKPNDPLGLNGYNCRHNHHPWFAGVSTIPKKTPEPKPIKYDGKTYDYYGMTQKMRSMERGVRALKREKEALSELGMDTTHIKARISKKTNEYMQFCDKCKINPKESLLRYECGTSDLKKTKAWKTHKEMLTPQRNIIKKIKYAKKSLDFEKTAREIQAELDEIIEKESKWSGYVKVSDKIGGSGEKNWNCNITLAPNAEYADALHEMVHGYSVSYYDEATYIACYHMEEGPVELLTEEMCKRKKVAYVKTYEKQVRALRRINRRCKISSDNFEFAKELIRVELPERMEWLIKKINNSKKLGIISSEDLEAVWEWLAVLAEEYTR